LLRTISTAMEIDPHKRFASAGQLASALSESLGTHPPAEIPAESQQLPARRSATKWILGGLLSAAVIVGFSLVWYGSASKSNRAPSDEFQKAQEKLLHSYKEANVADAVRGFQAVLQADPKNALAKARLGAAYLVQFQYSHDPKLLDLAKQETNSAMELERDLAAPFITLSRIAAIEGQTDLAMQQAKKALELEPRNAEGFGALGEVYEAEGREKEALDEYRKASDLAPEDWRWPVSLGVAEFGQGKIAESISELQRGIELAPDNAVAYFDLSVAHLQSHDVEAVRGDLEKSIAIEPTARAYSALGSALMYQGKYDNAESMDKKAIELSPDSYEAWEDLGAAYQWSGTKPELAAQAFRKAIDLAERERTKRRMDPALLVTLAEDYAAIGDLPKSMPLARQALALSPDDPTISYRAGETFEALGQREMAISLISKALLNGYHTYEFERNPLLGSLRSDPKFAARMNALIARKK
jgi:tetratricopeptide (TPR) repeat protein